MNSKMCCKTLFLLLASMACVLKAEDSLNVNLNERAQRLNNRINNFKAQASEDTYGQIQANSSNIHRFAAHHHSNKLNQKRSFGNPNANINHNVYANTDMQQNQANSDEQLKMIKRREEIERIKNEALIDVFKTKILKLLNVDEAPSPSEINIAQNPVPDPILREYNRLIRVSRMEKNKKYHMKNQHVESRGSRDLESEEYESENEQFFDESVRFNGSVVQQVMLLPKKCKFCLIFERISILCVCLLLHMILCNLIPSINTRGIRSFEIIVLTHKKAD